MAKPRKKAHAPADDRPVSLTLRIDSKTYLRLTTLRATQRRSHQDILLAALEDYLKRAGV